MLNRRFLLGQITAASLLAAGPARAASISFESFLADVAAEAQRGGVSPALLQRALASLKPNDKVLELDRRQAEFTLSWEQYRDGRLSQQRVDRGRQAFADNRALLDQVAERFQVSPRIVVAIWGLETNYGGFTGNFRTVEALATLAWDGRRSAFFRRELMAALRILQAGHVAPERMRGSHAGAMGQPQFMPTSFEAMAVDFDGDGRRDIWDSRADALGSIANYMARNGWREEERWGREVLLPEGFDPAQAGRATVRPLRAWLELGVAAANGSTLPPLEMEASILLPGGPNGQAFVIYPNFHVIRRYNPSDYYALVIGLLSDRVA
ncbi:lytic murein transglycosylase [Roseomonas sp. GC11]|uniref:lytic murein transglycosylase n=1 Tax=Roseomonas sp. GC11 TaxID=2950546 RepID=UPI002109319B|nr:lytic murein transglycosylase [Roseomonas sp. GC11]MCQ4159137.1 lytic murein transglycosylase [Roseomonas sp. GC11]